MRLVIVVPNFPQLSETFIISKFAGLVDVGWDAHIVCQQAALADWEQYRLLAARPELKHRIHQRWPHQPRVIAVLLWLPAFIITFIRAPGLTWRYWREGWRLLGAKTVGQFYLDAVIIGLAPDIVHFEFGALAVGQTRLKKMLGCYLSVSFRGYDLNYVGLDDPDFYGEVWRTVDAIHVLGNDLWQRALRRGCPPDLPHACIPPAIDIQFFMRDDLEPQEEPVDAERPLRILSVGRLEWKRGYEYALTAVRLVKERGIPFEYRIIGSGRFLEALAFARHEMGLEEHVHFLGGQPQSVIVEAMKWADVFLHPAVSEGFSNAVLEAQAMELPVVCTDSDGLVENVADELSGFIVPRRDPDLLAARLIQLAGDRQLRRRMGLEGRARVAHGFRIENQPAAFDQFFRGMVTTRAR